ncbi:hypothetical protein [Clostridium sp.]|uniref:hypothetical protein n=1 Tax=Clostridium sp. TaxID=1506 RepID=UPI0028453B70|nr:hypothetical protein [Clostridium sp.]MDR3598500.1 hypothetical protein [Clostridium sp.]
MLEKINLITIQPNELIEVAEKTIEQYQAKINSGGTTYGGANLKDIQILELRLQRVRMTPKGQEVYNKTVEILKERGIIRDKKENKGLTPYEVYQNYHSNFSSNR